MGRDLKVQLDSFNQCFLFNTLQLSGSIKHLIRLKNYTRESSSNKFGQVLEIHSSFDISSQKITDYDLKGLFKFITLWECLFV